MKAPFKVGSILVSSDSSENIELVSAALTHWLAHHGWIGLVGVEQELTQERRTRYGFNEVQVQFLAGEFQSNASREFYAEIPFDLDCLIEELELWLTKTSPLESDMNLLGFANQAKADGWVG